MDIAVALALYVLSRIVFGIDNTICSSCVYCSSDVWGTILAMRVARMEDNDASFLHEEHVVERFSDRKQSHSRRSICSQCKCATLLQYSVYCGNRSKSRLIVRSRLGLHAQSLSARNVRRE